MIVLWMDYMFKFINMYTLDRISDIAMCLSIIYERRKPTLLSSNWLREAENTDMHSILHKVKQ